MWKKNKNTYRSKSIQSLLIYRLFLVLIVVLIALGIYQYSNMKRHLFDSKIELLDSRFKNVEKNVILATNNNELLITNTEYILNLVSGEEICVAVINSEGETIGETNRYNGIRTDTKKVDKNILDIPTLEKDIYLKELNNNSIANGHYVIKDDNGQKQIIILREIGAFKQPAGLVQISTTIEDIEKILYVQIQVYIFSTVMALVLIGILGRFILKYTLKPLNELTYQLDNIDENQLNTRLNTNNRQIEIDILANKFNNMFQRLETYLKKEKEANIAMKNFILDVSHELRTPLTSIQGFIEVLQLGAYKDEEKLELALNSMMTESRRLSKLVNELLYLIKLEGNVSVEVKKENINDIINEVKSQLEILKRDRVLQIQLSEPMYCMVNKDQIKQVIYNLFQNAINHTEEVTGCISISTSTSIKGDSSWVEVNIKDNGEGISKEDINLIFHRFYRVDKHRSRKKGGHGLGLSIVKRIVYNHNGEINVHSEEGKGSTFTFAFREVK